MGHGPSAVLLRLTAPTMVTVQELPRSNGAFRRKEDLRLVTGRGRFADDLKVPGLCHAVVGRSSEAMGVGQQRRQSRCSVEQVLTMKGAGFSDEQVRAACPDR